jgi:hypothetical protein
VGQYIDPSSLGKVSLPSDELDGEDDHAGTFFYDHEMLYAYAGIDTTNVNGVSNSLWAFNTSTDIWKQVTVEGGTLQFNNNSEGEHASIPATGQSFYTGGFGIGVNGTYPGIVSFDSNDGSTQDPQWNFLTGGPTGISPPSVLKGSMSYIRRGQSGVLIVFGGFDVRLPFPLSVLRERMSANFWIRALMWERSLLRTLVGIGEDEYASDATQS